jgi:acetolactate decarboxylase
VDPRCHLGELLEKSLRSTYRHAFWPANKPGYHLHFLSDDHLHGGHLLELAAESLVLALHTESNLHLALPETAAFLAADLSADPSAALATAEGNRR